MPRRRTLVLVLVVVAVLIAAIYYLVRTKPSIRPVDLATEPTAPVSERGRGDSSDAPDAAPPQADAPNPAPELAAAPRDNPLRRSLQKKLGRPPSGSGGSGPAPRDDDRVARGNDPAAAASPPASWDSLPEEYVGKIIRDQLLPVAQACYDDLADKGTAGALTLSVAVLADADIGGAIDRVDIAKDGTTLEGELTECVRQAAYDMQFDPPPEGQGGKEFDLELQFSEQAPKGG